MASDSPRSFRPLAYRLSAHRRRAHGVIQLAFARHHGGTFVLRIEDTDIKRNTEEAVAAIYEGLQWLGLNWDEGPHVGGDFGPYFQSQRTRALRALSEKTSGRRSHFRRPGRDAISFAARARRGRRPRLRQNRFRSQRIRKRIPDMTIRRPDGSWIFHFVNVIDDIEMNITHVIRGEDHLSNTPKHIELYSRPRREAAALRAHPAHPEPRRHEDEQARQGRARRVLHPERFSARSRAQLSLPARLVAQGQPRENATSTRSSGFSI